MLSVEILVWAFIIFICAYAIINRICKCKEHCVDAESFSEACKNSNTAMNDRLRKSNDALVQKVLEGMANEQKSGNQAGSQTGTEGSDSHV